MPLQTSAVRIGRRLGAGGEAEVFEVADRPGLAYKRYRQPTKERAEKLSVMLAAPPSGASAGGHIAIAWPVELVVDASGVVSGFLMPRVDVTRSVPMFQLYNPQLRRVVAPAFTWRYLLRAARNLAAILHALHEAGYVVGDLNESNLLVSDRALVGLVDCDSMQVCDSYTGRIHRSPVAKAEFTAPELYKRDLASVDRSPATDCFALAVLVFQLLLEGVHPFAGIWRGRGDPPDIGARIRRRQYAYAARSSVAPPPHALSPHMLPPPVRRLVDQTFKRGLRNPAARPAAGEWLRALEAAESALVECTRSRHHVYSAHLRRCPWCDRIDAGLPDPFPGTGNGVGRRPPSRVDLAMEAALRTWRGAATVALRSVSRVLHRFLPADSRPRIPAFLTLAGAGLAAPVLAPLVATVVVAPLATAFASESKLATARRAGALVGPAVRSWAWALPASLAIAVVGCGAVAGGVPPLGSTAHAALAILTVASGGIVPARLPGWDSSHLPSVKPWIRWSAAAAAAFGVAVGPFWWPLPG